MRTDVLVVNGRRRSSDLIWLSIVSYGSLKAHMPHPSLEIASDVASAVVLCGVYYVSMVGASQSIGDAQGTQSFDRQILVHLATGPARAQSY